jgi:hypothetical protein
MSFFKRFHLFLRVLPIILVLVLVKIGVQALHLEFVPLDGLVPSLIAGSIFLIGFLLSQVLADYKESEHMPGEIRVALEAIHDDVLAFAATTPGVDLAHLRQVLVDIVSAFETSVGIKGHHADLSSVIGRVDALSPFFAELERLKMSERYVVRLRHAQDTLRKCLFRVSYVQRMQFLPSVHVLVQSLVIASLFVLLFLKTSGTWESVLVLVFVGYMFVYALYLIEHLDQPFRTGERTVDDVSIFLLRDFVEKLGRA